MAEIEGEGWPEMAGYSAHTNGPGSIDDKEYPHPASFMRNLSPTSCLFSIGSAVLHKNSKKTQPVNLEDIPITCGTPNHTCPFVDADLLGKARRAEYVRRAAYDTRVELARREEHDRRMEYALNLAFGQPRNASTIEDYEVQACRLEQMGKLIDNLTTMITKSSRHEAAAAEAIETTLVSSSSQQVLAIEDTAGGSYEDCEDWSLHMTDEEGKALSVLIRIQEPGEFSSQEVLARKVRRIPRPDMDPQREVKAGLGFDRAPEVELEKARRAEYDRRAAYDTRAELSRREEHDRRMEYALNLAFGQPRNASTIEDYELQACRLEQMGKLIENLTTMITKSSRHEAAAAESIETTLVSSCSQQVREHRWNGRLSLGIPLLASK